MARQSTPPVTVEEIHAVLAAAGEDVLSAGDVAVRVWWKRGGVGAPADATRWGRSPRVPLVRDYHVRNHLAAMVKAGEVASAVGRDAATIGRLPHGWRTGTTYYVRADVAARTQARLAEQQDRIDHARTVADALAAVLGVPATVVGDSTIRISLPVEQATALVERQRKLAAVDCDGCGATVWWDQSAIGFRDDASDLFCPDGKRHFRLEP